VKTIKADTIGKKMKPKRKGVVSIVPFSTDHSRVENITSDKFSEAIDLSGAAVRFICSNGTIGILLSIVDGK
jgi:hypothetical protein